MARLVVLAKTHKKKLAAVVIFALAVAAGLSPEAAGQKAIEVLGALAEVFGQ